MPAIEARLPRERLPRRLPGWVRGLLVVALLYLFLVGVALLTEGIERLGSEVHEAIFQGVTNPVAGLFAGILATVVVQSSSVSTSTIVSLVAAGVVNVEVAVPMVMGANIGTTVTNTLVSLGHLRHTEEFRRAFAGATMHDFFNVLAVLVFLPVQLLTGFLSEAARWSADLLSGGEVPAGGQFESPLKEAVGVGAGQVEGMLAALAAGRLLGVVSILVGVGLIFLTLVAITRNMRLLVAARIERSLNAALTRSGLVGIGVGTVVTVAVQSSSITTSILIPLIASGILVLEAAYPITLGANLGTTVTALIASLALPGLEPLTIALTHTLFNLGGILVFYPIPALRRLPLRFARLLATLAVRNRALAAAYVFGGFLVIPMAGILILR